LNISRFWRGLWGMWLFQIMTLKFSESDDDHSCARARNEKWCSTSDTNPFLDSMLSI
jgi:hypothetical protein